MYNETTIHCSKIDRKIHVDGCIHMFSIRLYIIFEEEKNVKYVQLIHVYKYIQIYIIYLVQLNESDYYMDRYLVVLMNRLS